MTPTVLVVEDSAAIGAPLVEQLVADGYLARLARTAEHARVLARASPPELVILGALEAPRSALQLLSEIRASHRLQGADPDTPWVAGLPVIVLSVGTQESDLLRAFEAGADDFLVRPASYLELRARLRALLARTDRAASQSLVCAGPLTINVRARAVNLNGHVVPLRRLEYELLLTLAREPERVFTRHELLHLVWGYRAPGRTRTLDSHVSRLRHRLGGAGAQCWIVNVRGVGYRLR